MEVGDQASDDPHLVAWGNHQSGAGFKVGEPMQIEKGYGCFQGFTGRQSLVVLIGVPLFNVERAQGHALLGKHHPDPIETLQGAGAGGTHGDDGGVDMPDEVFEKRPAHHDGR